MAFVDDFFAHDPFVLPGGSFTLAPCYSTAMSVVAVIRDAVVFSSV